MFTTFRPQPRPDRPLPANRVTIASPLPAPPTDRRPLWLRIMPLAMAVLMLGTLAMMVSMGSRAITSMLFTLPMMGFMAITYIQMMRGGSNTGEDLDQQIDEYDLELRQRRSEIHEQGRAMHNLRTTNFPHPADLLSLVGTDEMWQADPSPDIGKVVTEEAIAEDPNVRNLTSNPWLRARVGIGVAELYPKLVVPDETPVLEMLEPATMVRYLRAMNTLSVVANLPLDVNLGEFPAYSLRGDESARLNLARAMVMSLAFNHRPGDLAIGVVTEDPDSWEWVKWLPHLEDLSRVEKSVGPRLLTWRSLDEFASSNAAAIEQLRAGSAGDSPPHLLLIVDTPDQVVSWPPNLVGGVRGMTWLVVRYGSDLVSSEESRILIDGERVSTIRDYDAATRDEISPAAAEAFARAMYRYRPRGYGQSGVVADDRPEHIPDFFEALRISDIETHDLPAVWRENAYTDEIKIPFGYRRNGEETLPELAYLNFYDMNRDGDGPHGGVQGVTGSGKSYFLRAVVLSLVARYGPEKVALILADFKGGATFIGMSKLPHTVANISNLLNSTELVERLGAVLQGEVDRRMQVFADKGLADIFSYRSEQQKRAGDPEWPPLPDLIVIIDEFGEFLKNNAQYMALLISIGRIGRTLGIHLVMCSQFLDRVILGDLIDQTTFRFSLAVQSEQQSRNWIGSESAHRIGTTKGGLRGKILQKLNSDPAPVEVVAFQHEAPYVQRTAVERSRAGAAGNAESSGPVVVPFSLFADHDFTPVVAGEVEEEVEEVSTADNMGSVLLEKVSRLREMSILDLWQPSLREPLSLSTAAGGLSRESAGLRIRIGDLDAPQRHARFPWFMDFGGAVPHQVIAGGGKSGRTTALQTLVISGCLQHRPHRLAFLLADYGSGKLGEVRNSPNVAAYAKPGDENTVYRILGEARRIIELRRIEMGDREVSSVDAYLQSKENDPVAGDPYGYVVVAIDGIGGFLGEDGDSRRERSRLLRPILDSGAAAGVHLVYTADSMGTGVAGNQAHYSFEVKGGIQLPSTDYSAVKMPSEVRLSLAGLIPADQPGRSYDAASRLHARTMVPINVTIEPEGEEEGMPVFPVTDYVEEIRDLCTQLPSALDGDSVPPVLTAATRIDFEIIWSQFAPLVDPRRNPAHTIIPLGVRMDTLELAPIPNYSQNLLVYGEKQSGRTNTLRCVIESLMRQFTPDQAAIIVVDPLLGMLSDRDRLYASGYVAQPAFSEPDENGERKRLRPPGYVTSDADLEETVRGLSAAMFKRRPGDDTTVEQLQNRTYFTGKEIYVVIDNFFRLTAGFNAFSVFDDDRLGPESVTRLLASGLDLGVHFIIADDTGFADRVKASQFLMALRDKMMSPILQLAGQPSSGTPIGQAFHLKPTRWRPGQGRLIVDAEDYSMVQTGFIDTDTR